jgi:hypothetical protein
MNCEQIVVDRKEAENVPSEVLEEAQRARAALDQALQGIVCLLDLLLETDSAEQEYWSLCDERQSVLAPDELPADLQAVLAVRRQQRMELRAMFEIYYAAEHRWLAARRKIDHLIHRLEG